MTTEHTPGPWFAEAVDGRWRVWDDDGIACICDVHAGVEPDPSGFEHACLIAAAPDLLTVLEVLLPHLEDARMADGAKAAIAKARGETA